MPSPRIDMTTARSALWERIEMIAAQETAGPRAKSAQSTDLGLLADAMGRAARAINSPTSLTERLQAIVETAPDAVPGFDGASISLSHRDGTVETRAASNALVEKLDLYQYEVQQGPCFEAFTRLEYVSVPSVAHEQRWPKYIAVALRAGVVTQMALPLGSDGGVHGALNLYSTVDEGIDPEAPGVAALFAQHAALALGWARTEEQLNVALGTRKMIGQAIGILMERYQINEQKAFGFLTRVSQTSNIKLRNVAQEVCTQTETQYTVKDS